MSEIPDDVFDDSISTGMVRSPLHPTGAAFPARLSEVIDAQGEPINGWFEIAHDASGGRVLARPVDTSSDVDEISTRASTDEPSETADREPCT